MHIVAAASVLEGSLRTAKAAFSTAVWSLPRGPSAMGGHLTHFSRMRQATLESAGEEQELGLSTQGWLEVLQFPDESNGLISAVPHVLGEVIVSTYRCTRGYEPISGMLDIKDARCLLSGRVRWGGRGAISCELVEGGRKSDCGAVLHWGVEGCGDSGPESDKVCVIGVSNGVYSSVCNSNGLKRALKHQCEKEGPRGSPWCTPRAETTSTVPESLSENKRTVD
jgi:hypothetical protein